MCWEKSLGREKKQCHKQEREEEIGETLGKCVFKILKWVNPIVWVKKTCLPSKTLLNVDKTKWEIKPKSIFT